MSAFVVSNIATDLKMLSNDQRFIFGNNTLPEPLAAFKIDNIFTPVVGTPSVTNFETRNNTLSGFRWIHTTTTTDTFGSYKLQSFVNAQSTGTDILLFNQDGTITFTHPVTFPGFAISGDLNMNNYKIVNLADPINDQDAATKVFVESLVGSGTITLSGAVSGSGQVGSDITTMLNTVTIDKLAGYPADSKLFLRGDGEWSNNFATIGVNVDPTEDGVIQFANGAADVKIILNKDTPSNPFDLSGIGFYPTFGTLYHTPIGKSHAFFTGANGNLALEITPIALKVGYGRISSTDFRKVVFYEGVVDSNPNQTYAIGVELDGAPTNYRHLRNQVQTINDAFRWCYGIDADTSGEWMRLNNTGLNLYNRKIFNVLDPVDPQDVATKYYVDDSINNFSFNNPIILIGAVTGSNSINNPIFTTFASTIPVNGASQIFNFSLNSNVVYRLNNTLVATTGTPSTIALSLNNATNGGYRLLHTSTSTDPAGLGTLKLQALNSSGVTADVFTNSISGGGIPDTLFNGTATFDGTVTIQNNQSLIVTGNVGIGGSTSPNAALQFGNVVANRKIVLYETDNNDHQYYGFGINNGLLRYQIDSTTAAHAWYAASSGTTSNELMRLNGNGQLRFNRSNSLSSIISNDTNPSSFQNDIFFFNNGNYAVSFGFNNAANEAYVWAYGTATLKFGTAATERFRITPTGDAVFQNTIFGRRVSGLMTMQNNAVGTTVTTANIFVKVAGTTVASNLNGVSSPVSNRLTHTATNSIIAYVNVSFTAIHNGGGGEETTFALYKNGAQLPDTINSSQQLNNLKAISITTSVSMNTNDYIELWCTSPNNGRVITVKHLMFNYTTT